MRTALALATLFLLLPGLAGAMQERKTVVSVRFEGNRRYTGQFLREQVRTKAGEPLDAALLSLDELTLRRYFTAVTDIEELEV